MENLERLNKMLTAIAGALAGIGAGAMALTNLAAAPYITALCAIAFAVLLVRVMQAGSVLRIPEHFQLRANNPRHLVGRSEDVHELESLCQRSDTVVLVGQSGAGKTSVLRSGLIQQQLSSKTFLPVYLNRWDAGDWVSGPSQELARALHVTIASLEPNYSDQLAEARIKRTDDPFAALDRLRQTLGVKVLLVLDQIERYIVRHGALLQAADQRTMLTNQALIDQNAFWRGVAQRVSSGSWIVLCAIPQEMAFSVEPFRFGATHQYWLKNIYDAEIRAFLTRMGEVESPETRVIVRPEDGWNRLVERLVDDLTEQNGRVLGAQLRIALQGIATLGRLSERAYVQAGGLPGLEMRVVKASMYDTASRFAISPSAVITILSMLIDRSSPVLTSRSVSLAQLRAELASHNLGEHTELQVAAIFRHLDTEWSLLRERVHGDGSSRWSLAHDYLCDAISRADIDASSPLNLYYREFVHAGANPVRRWSSLLPPLVQVAVFKDRFMRRLTFNKRRRYVALSLLRWTPYALAALLAADHGLGISSDGKVQEFIDFTGLSVFRRVPDLALARQHGAKVGHSLRKELLSQISPSGGPIVASGESWGIGQVVFALSCGPTDEESRRAISIALSSLYKGKLLVRDRNGAPYAWRRAPRNRSMFALPALWTVAAAARSAAWDPSGAEWLRIGAQVASNFKSGDAWTFYPNAQRGASNQYASLYASVLGLQYLLELHQLHNDQRAAIERTVKWFIGHHKNERRPGWQSYAEHGPMVEGLSLQIYAVLLRASEQMSIALPVNILDGAARRLALLERPDFDTSRQETNENWGTYQTELGEVEDDEILVTYAWLPWAVDLATRWLRLADTNSAYHPARADSRRVRRVYGNLLGDPQLERWARESGTWAVAELYIALSGCSSAKQ